jgi:hypothetical protein
MKQPINWHKECLGNITRYTEQKEAEAQRVLMESKAMRERVNHLKMQITHAIRAGKDGFDADKFMVKRKVA